ncbi:hypothetical protein RIF23_08170 [Lipingzhangella sp. LS1_29]|uniref:Uncharacterized protein n=1 Tax=Lipingzhangella rawalii TaxID=2055835 RepID=A0ABU2H4N4_9ACTN|nr:hypothetical protein [Lipingzhangella rawalii]MDS1270267.1 hypothetical protein [Lipingzhangella rawalii]
MSLEEAARQLESAIHDARVSFDCIGLGNLERAHTSVITARAAVDAAETSLRAELERRDDNTNNTDDAAEGAGVGESGGEQGLAGEESRPG